MLAPCLLLVALCQAPAKFPEATHAGGQLKYVQGVPVLTVKGTPAEIGEQYGVLAVRNAPDLPGLLDRFLADAKMTEAYPSLKQLSRSLAKRLPADHRAELEAAAKASGQELDVLLFANTIADISSGMGCSTLVVEPGRSGTGSPLFGRLFDWQPTRGLTEHTLLVVCKPAGKRGFVSVGYTPITGVISGMNDAGLAVTMNEIELKQLPDKPGFNWAGTPLVSLYRRVLEECATVAEAETLVRAAGRTTSACMTVCDANGGAVFEISPKVVQVRKAVDQICCCTNHFTTDGLRVEKQAARCKRLPKLEAVRAAGDKLAVADVFARLDEVHQGKATLQAMVFEPRERRLHLKYGDGPATKRPATTFDVGELLK